MNYARLFTIAIPLSLLGWEMTSAGSAAESAPCLIGGISSVECHEAGLDRTYDVRREITLTDDYRIRNTRPPVLERSYAVRDCANVQGTCHDRWVWVPVEQVDGDAPVVIQGNH